MSETLVLQVPKQWTSMQVREAEDAVAEAVDGDVFVVAEGLETLSKSELTAMLENTIEALHDND